MTMKLNQTIGFIVFAVTVGAGAVAQAQGFDQEHPRRGEVTKRLDSEEKRINAGQREGELGRKQAHQLRNEDRAIRAEERADSALNHGHITKGEHRQLNRQEDQLSRQIHRDR